MHLVSFQNFQSTLRYIKKDGRNIKINKDKYPHKSSKTTIRLKNDDTSENDNKFQRSVEVFSIISIFELLCGTSQCFHGELCAQNLLALIRPPAI